MKKGLTYISERTGQLRYADDAEQEQWVQQTSTYIPLVEIKRGQPVSIATIEDLKIIADGNDDLFEALKASSDTYIVLTNPSRHYSTVGLALEYTKGGVSLSDGSLVVADKIHIIGQGLYIEDKDYIGQAFTESDDVDVSSTEYWPAFFDDYENSIGKKIYVKGNSDGILTLVKEDAYLAYNNVIVVGFVSDANIKNGTNAISHGAIEVQMMGDDRGAIDATQFEAVLGEDVYIGQNAVQINGETNNNTKVFALGCDDDEKFEFSFNFFENQLKTLPKGFIAIQRIDGATAYVCVNGDFTEDDVLNNEEWNANDRAFVQVARYYAITSGNSNVFLGNKDYNASLAVAPMTDLAQTVSDAFAAVSAGEITSLKDGKVHNANALTNYSSSNNTFHFIANDVGGTYEVYISSTIASYVTGLYIASHGANYNKGYAVLADIRNKNRQNILGIYNSGHTGLIAQGTRAIFLSKGLFTDPTNTYEVGSTYYLGSHGNVFLVPQEFYNSIVKIGMAQTSGTLIVNCNDARQYNNGDLPVGYMKPSVKGEPEFGFWLMDGKTPHKTGDAEHLFTVLKGYYDESELNIKSYNFGSDEEPDWAEGFIIPSVQYHSYYDTDNTTGYVAAQIKWLASDVYKEMPRQPFVRRAGTITKFTKDGVTYDKAILPDFDITSLMIYGPDEDRMQVPDLENLDIKLFVDIDPTSKTRNWVQLEPGFHTSNNFTYYGFKWTVIQTEKVSASHPYGEYALRAVYSGTELEDTENVDTRVLGVCLQADPYAPPMSLAGCEVKVYVTKHDYYSRQFDVEALFKDYVKESVVDVQGNPWVSNAVSGQAVRDDIKNRVDTDDLDISDETSMAGTVDAYVKRIFLQSSKEDYTDEDATKTAQNRHKYFNSHLIKSDLRLQNPNGTDVWFTDYENGLLQFSTADSTVTSTQLESKVRNNDYALMPYFIYKAHENALIDGNALLGTSFDKVTYPHGIKNTGFTGTINARQLQGANLGYGSYVFSQNADDTLTTEDSGSKVSGASTKITVPFTQFFDNKYTTRLGNVIKHYNGTNNWLTDDIEYSDGTLTETLSNTNVLKYKRNTFGLYETYNISDKRIDFTVGDISSDDTNETNWATIKALWTNPSSIAYKYLLHSFANDNADTTFIENYSTKDKRLNYTEPMNEALQALYELPLATFKYNRDYEIDEANSTDYYKRFFGIIVEQTANTSKKFASDEEIGNKTTLDNLAYTYTADEAKSISEYMKLVTDNNEAGMNTSTVVGMLLKAAKETQERLLNLEVSTFGKDSPTLPGSDKVNSNYSQDQKSTIAGLNRLVKALCQEVFQDSDPTNSNVEGAWSGEAENQYSRLDMLDAEVNGKDATQDNKTRISLKDVTTYPADASVTQTVTYEHQYIKDADKDDDFDSAQQFLKTATYDTVDGIGLFDGINDAVNKIVAKLNQLTVNVNGTDNIKNRPVMLDYIRQTLETILREIYDDSNATADSIENESYKKAKVSRIDRIIEELFNFDLTVGANKVEKTNGQYNGKYLKGNKIDVDADTNTFASFNALSPESLEELKSTASIIDVIIQLLTGDEKTLTRTDARDFKDRDVTTEGYKAAASGETTATGVTYDPAKEWLENNNIHFNNDDIISRLNAIEKALQLISLKVQNKLDFTNLATRNYDEPYDKVTSIDDYFNYIAGLFGITFEKNGFYATERKADVVAESINKIKKAADSTGKQNSLDLYNIIYDAVTRIKNNEWAIKYNSVALGPDFDDYKSTKSTYEDLSATTPSHTKEYTVTSDMRAILKLLYGADSGTSDDDKNNTTYSHFLTANESNDNFVHSPAALTGGVSILDELYKMLYNVPAIVVNGELTTQSLESRTETDYTKLQYDPANPCSVNGCDDVDNTTLIGKGHRTKYISQSGAYAPLNRIDILENEMKALWNYLGMGAISDSNYFSGNFTFAPDTTKVTSSVSNSEGTKVKINSGDYNVSSVYSELSTSESYHLSAVALQAYYNSVDLASILKRTGAYSLNVVEKVTAQTTNKKYVSGLASTDVNGVLTKNYNSWKASDAIEKALTYARDIDTSLQSLRKEFIEQDDTLLFNIEKLWTVLGTDYSATSTISTVDARLDALESRVGSPTQDEDSADTLFQRVASNDTDIAALRAELGKKSDTSSDTVYSRLDALEKADTGILASLNSTNESATVTTSSIANEQVFKTVTFANAASNSEDTEDNENSDTSNDSNGEGITDTNKATTTDTAFSSEESDESANSDTSSTTVVYATHNSIEKLVSAAVKELQSEMTLAIQNNRKLAALMAYMKCDDIKASTSAIQFVRSGGNWTGYDMQEASCVFKFNNTAEINTDGESTKTGYIICNSEKNINYCGEPMVSITFEDFVDHLKFTCYVPYNKNVMGTENYSNQTFGYGSGNYSTSLDDDSYIITID